MDKKMTTLREMFTHEVGRFGGGAFVTNCDHLLDVKFDQNDTWVEIWESVSGNGPIAWTEDRVYWIMCVNDIRWDVESVQRNPPIPR